MTDEQRIEQAQARYQAAAHAMQSAVAYEIGEPFGPRPQSASPKHLRVGVNSAHVSDVAIVNLLIAKGVFTEVEYCEALADAMEAELKRYEGLYPGLTFA